ncbi:MAG: PAS domain S-box protein [Pirellulales bacterium]|nr:PAS domain S-box protein [Pirellulales bacterium]
MAETYIEHDEVENLRCQVGALEELLDVHEETVRQQTARLEDLIRSRTWELTLTNQLLEKEIAQRDRAQKALRESQERFELAMRGANDGLWDFDVETGKAYYSPRWKSMLGYRDDEIENTFEGGIACIHPDDRPSVLEAIEAYKAGKREKFEVEFRMRHKDGHFVSVLSRGFGVRDLTGRVIRMVGTHVDLTQRKAAAEALRASERSHREIFNTVTDSILVFDYQAGVVADANESVCELLGCTHEEALRLRLADLCVGEPPFTEENAQKVVQQAVENGWFQLEWLLRTRRGEPLWVDVILKRANIDGQDRVLMVGRDIRERKRAEAELARHREHLEELVQERTAELAAADKDLRWKTAFLEALSESSLDGILVVDQDNRRLLTTQRLVDLWNVPADILADPDDAALVNYVVGMARDPETFRQRVVYLYAHPTEASRDVVEFTNGVVMDRYSTPVLGPNGEHYGRVWFFRDITAQRQAEEERERLNKQLLETSRRMGMADVATGVLHNVGNVLNSVNVSGTLVTDKIRNSKLPQLVRAVDRMKEHADDLGAFVTEHPQGKHVLRFLDELAAQLTREREGVQAELQSLMNNVDHIKQVVSMQQSYAKAGGVTITTSVDELLDDAIQIQAASFSRHHIEVVRETRGVSAVQIDKQKTLQILVNLLANAKHALRDARREDRRLTVRVEPAGDDRFRLEVADNGVGIAPENLTRIFTHGFTTKSDGHGYGLHNSALAAQELGGTLTAWSDGLGRGATFTLELPLKPAENKK